MADDVSETAIQRPKWALWSVVWRLFVATIVLQGALFMRPVGPTFGGDFLEAVRVVMAIWLVAGSRNIWERWDDA